MGNSGKTKTPEGVYELDRLATSLFKQTKPVRTEVLNQTEEALKTGGVNARIPIIQRAVEATRAGAGQTTQATEESLAKAGIAGTPFAERILADIRQKGALDTSTVQSNIINQIIGNAPGVAAQFLGQGIGAKTQAAGMDIQVQEFNDLQYKAFMQDLKDSIQSAAGGASMCLPKGTLIMSAKGWTPIEHLQSGQRIVTRAPGGEGAGEFAQVLEVSRVRIEPTHEFVELEITHGTTLHVSPGHPIAGRAVGDLAVDDPVPVYSLSNRFVLSTKRVAMPHVAHTYDIRVQSETGEYLVWPGVWMQSTLDARHELGGNDG